jgi:hypothetical protein
LRNIDRVTQDLVQTTQPQISPIAAFPIASFNHVLHNTAPTSSIEFYLIRLTEAQKAEQNVSLRGWYAKSILIGLGVEAVASLVALFGCHAELADALD